MRMTIEEAHMYEDELEKELREKDPTNKALKYYGSTWKAIDSYNAALKELKEAEKSLKILDNFVIQSGIQEALRPTIEVAAQKGIFDEFSSEIWGLHVDLFALLRRRNRK